MFRKIIQSLYCVDVDCAICEKSLKIKLWHSFRNAATYFCEECGETLITTFNKVGVEV